MELLVLLWLEEGLLGLGQCRVGRIGSEIRHQWRYRLGSFGP